MLRIERILYPTDFSRCASYALPYAVELAERLEAELQLLHATVLHEGDPANAAHQLPNIDEVYRALEAQAEAQLRSMAREIGGRVPRLTHAQTRSVSAAAAILDFAAENTIDLIVMGTHGRRGLKRLLLGSVAEEVVRLAPCPVLTVPERGDRLKPETIARVVVPVDFSEHSALALAHGKAFAALYDAEIHLLHVIYEVAYPDFYPPVLPSYDPAAGNRLRKESEERMAALLADVPGPPVIAHRHVRVGRPAPTIAEFAHERGAGLIVVASHGLTGLRHVLLGSVTEQLIRRATCPVFTAKAFGKKLVSWAGQEEPG
jgi:nucleotide-binding universal stress UspA family protein